MAQSLSLPDNDKRTPEEMRASVLALEAAMLAMPEHQIEIKTKHYFSPGVYMREILIPAGVVLTGKIHKTEHMCVVTRGRVQVVTDDGVKELKSGDVIRSMPGAKRCMVALEESIWLNVHHNPTNERDLDKIDSLFVVDTFEEFQLSQSGAPKAEALTDWTIESTQVTKRGDK